MQPVGGIADLNYKMRLHGSATRLRKTIRGEVVTTVPKGADIVIWKFVEGKQSDGYQWCYGRYGSHYGYFQYDPDVMFPKGNG